MSFTLQTLQEAIEAHPARYTEALALCSTKEAQTITLRERKWDLKEKVKNEEDPEKHAALIEEWNIFCKELEKAEIDADDANDARSVLDETFQCYRLLTDILTYKEEHCRCTETHIHPDGTLRVRGQVDLAVHVPDEVETEE